MRAAFPARSPTTGLIWARHRRRGIGGGNPRRGAGGPLLRAEVLGQQDGLRDLLHALAAVHGLLLDLAEGVGLGEAALAHEDALGALDGLAGLQRLLGGQLL